MSVPTSLNRSVFSGLDFLTHVDELLSRIQTEYSDVFDDFTQSDQSVVLIDAVAYGLDTLSFQIDRRATDQYLATARTAKSVAAKARQLGYKPRPAVAASVDLLVQIPTVYGFPVTIPAGFQYPGPNGTVWEVSRAVTFAVGEQGPTSAAKIVSCYEGTTYVDSFTSAGTPDQVFDLARAEGRFIALGSVQVQVDGAPWREVDFFEFTPDEQFEVDYLTSPPKLRFGSGVSGKIPGAGAAISVRYVVTRGKAGMIERGQITAPVTPLVVSLTRITQVVTQSARSSGADDAEDLESIKANAPAVAKSRAVAVTAEDYKGLAQAYADPRAGRVAAAVAVSPRSAAGDTTTASALSTIQTVVSTPSSVVATERGSARATLDSLRAALASLRAQAVSIAGQASVLGGAVASARTEHVQARGQTADSATYAADVLTSATLLKTAIQAVPSGGSDALTPTTSEALLSFVDAVLSRDTLLTTQLSALQSTLTQLGTRFAAMESAVAVIGTSATPSSATGTAVQKQSALLDDGVVLVGVPETPTGLYATLDTIQAAVVDTTATVAAQAQLLYAHVDRLLASDCKANLVSVPILARDAGGFYTAPSVALIQSLQSYLDARKETTQTVAVVSGADALVPAVIQVRLAVSQGFSVRVVQAAVTAVLDSRLRGRAFGSSLYLDALYTAVRQIAGIAYVNLTILGYQNGAAVATDLLDVSGNLIVPKHKVVTKGALVYDPDPPTQVTE